MESLPIQLIIATLLGAAIGLERESSDHGQKPGAIGGIRTYSLVGLLGALAGIMYIQNFTAAFIFVAAIFASLLVIYYFFNARLTSDLGVTTEIAFLYTFIIGMLITTRIIPLQLIIAIFVVLMVILAFKSRMRQLTSGVSRYELESFISYAIIALVILPFLPNTAYTISQIPLLSDLLGGYGINLGKFADLELINPRKIWMIVVLVTGIDVFGYLLSKFISQKNSFAMTSFVAGFVSSTSATQSLAQRSKKSAVVNYLVGAAALANMASFLQIILLAGPINAKWLVAITPTILLMVAASLIFSFALSIRKEKDNEQHMEQKTEGKIFSLLPALKFACLLILVKLFTKISLIIFGSSGFLVSSIIASFAGLDAIILNLADMAGKAIDFKFALLTLILVNATNLLSKTTYAFMQGNRKFAVKFLIFSIIIIAVSFSGLLFI